MTADNIKLLIATGEGYNVEFKAAVPAKVRELSEEVCAFANSAGGVLLVGVDDQGHLIGTSLDNTRRSAIQNSLREISPPLSCMIQVLEVDGKSIGVIEVPSGPQKPYVLSGSIYVRMGPNTQKVTTVEQMRDFFQQTNKIFFDEIPCPEFHVQTMIHSEFLQAFKIEARIGLDVPNEQLFTNLRLFATDHIFKNGAVLFFGRNPERILEKAVVRCVCYGGKDKRFIVDDKCYGGNLYHQYQQALWWIRGKLNVGYDIEGQGSKPRKEIWEIPETVFKEVIINALSHRDYYEKGAVTLIELFDDRIEISNPGGLVSAISESDFGKRSHSRNPLIFGLFSRMNVVEQLGSGIPRVYVMMKEAGLPDPIFQTEGMFTVTLFRPRNGEKPGMDSLHGSRDSFSYLCLLA